MSLLKWTRNRLISNRIMSTRLTIKNNRNLFPSMFINRVTPAFIYDSLFEIRRCHSKFVSCVNLPSRVSSCRAKCHATLIKVFSRVLCEYNEPWQPERKRRRPRRGIMHRWSNPRVSNLLFIILFAVICKLFKFLL